MRLRLLLTALVVSTAPGLALAQCFGDTHKEANLSCPEGQTFDHATETCKPLPTG